ncbi:MAG: helix-turn-helix transcriptional regulator [Moraxella sp.]|nr:helix-turn-helix transcriptional regulator [Moraxella sp.]
MAVSAFGRAVRKARLSTDDTLATMAKGIGKSVAFISAIETGRSKVPMDYIQLVVDFFAAKNYVFSENLWELASVDNQNVPIDHLDYQQQMLVAGFASSPFNAEELKQIADFLTEIRQVRDNLHE